MRAPIRVLVADDSRLVRGAMQHKLAQWGIPCVLASDGEEAWRILQQPSAPRIAILDGAMPGADGFEICRRVRAMQSDHYTYLILLTANEGEEAIAAGFAAGADDYLFKGAERHVLRTRLTVAERIIGVQEELLHAREILRAQARHDTLTGLLNRRAGEEELELELARAAHGTNCLSLLLLDIDHFKSINDTLGHPAGDAVLVAISAAMRDALRSGDTLVRWGGEEFLVLLPEVDLADAVEAAERMRRAIAGTAVDLGGHLLGVTASFGVATAPVGGRARSELLAAADAALYRAKTRSRNCVVSERPIAAARKDRRGLVGAAELSLAVSVA